MHQPPHATLFTINHACILDMLMHSVEWKVYDLFSSDGLCSSLV